MKNIVNTACIATLICFVVGLTQYWLGNKDHTFISGEIIGIWFFVITYIIWYGRER